MESRILREEYVRFGGRQNLSYYRFRNAEPEIFLDKYHEFKKESDNNELILLNENFRSSPDIVDGINSVFEKIMTEELGEINYDNEARLIASRTDRTIKPEIHILTSEKDKSNDESEKSIVREVRLIAKKIRELVGTTVAGKKLTYNDFGILYRSINKDARLIMEILSEEGIPVIFDGNPETVDAQEIRIFIQFLSLIDNHKQDIPLLTVLHLPIFDITLEDEAIIRESFPDTKYYFQAVENYRDQKEDDLAERLKDFYQKLDYWRDLSKHLDIDDYLWRLLLESKYYNYIGNLDGGKERKRNLRILLERAVSYKNSSLKGLPSFLQFADNLKKRKQPVIEAGAGSETEDAVHLMSIHKSKGLEFPILFIGGIGKNINAGKSDSKILYNKRFGYGAQHFEFQDNVLIKNETLLYAAIKEQLKREELSEEMRLLYVAMTRAKDGLYLYGTMGSNTKLETYITNWASGTDSFDLLNRNSYLDWIMSALYNPAIKNLLPGDTQETKKWKISLHLPEPAEEHLEVEDEVEIDEDDLRERIYQKLDNPSQEVLNSRPVKLSVTHLKRYGTSPIEPVDLLELDESEREKLDYAAIGTAIHRILQDVDLNALTAPENIENEVENKKQSLLSRGEITKDQSEDVQTSIVKDFYESDLGQRLIKSWNENNKNVLKEMPFSLDIRPSVLEDLSHLEDRPIEISGVIDACFLEDGKWILIDYKTDRFYNESLWKQRLEEYQLQIILYAMALEKLTGIEVAEKHIYFLTQKKDEKVD